MRMKVDYGLLAAALLPVAALLVNDRWMLTDPFLGNIDHWIYVGYFVDLANHTEILRGHYFGSRLAWILPGVLSHAVLPTLLASYVLHLSFFAVATSSLYLILRRFFGPRPALLSVVLFALCAPTLQAMGWDYIDGPGISYFLVTLLLLLRAAEAGGRWQTRLKFAGASWGALIYLNPFWLLYTPALSLLYLSVDRESGRNPPRECLIAFLKGFLWLTLGYMLLTASMFGHPIFFASSLNAVFKYGGSSSGFHSTSLAWVLQATYLILPVTMSLISAIVLGALVRRRPLERNMRFAALLLALLPVTLLASIACELFGPPVLSRTFYASYLLPLVFLSMGALFWLVGVGELRAWTFGLLFAGLTFIVAFPLAQIDDPVRIRLVPLELGILAAALGLVAILLVRSPLRGFALLALAIELSAINAGHAIRVFPDTRNRPTSRQAGYVLIADTARFLGAHLDATMPRFWLDVNNPFFASISALYAWHRVDGSFPSIRSPERFGPGMHMVVVAEAPDAMPQARRELGKFGFVPKLVARKTFRSDQLEYTVTVIELEEPPRG